MKFLALLIAALAFNCVNRGIAASPRKVTAADSGHSITLRIGEELVLNLESNPSTGYSWFLADTKTSVLASLGKPTYKQERAVPGAGGVESWAFRAVATGAQTLSFEYRRPWEKKIAPAKTVKFPVTVR